MHRSRCPRVDGSHSLDTQAPGASLRSSDTTILIPGFTGDPLFADPASTARHDGSGPRPLFPIPRHRSPRATTVSTIQLNSEQLSHTQHTGPSNNHIRTTESHHLPRIPSDPGFSWHPVLAAGSRPPALPWLSGGIHRSSSRCRRCSRNSGTPPGSGRRRDPAPAGRPGGARSPPHPCRPSSGRAAG